MEKVYECKYNKLTFDKIHNFGSKQENNTYNITCYDDLKNLIKIKKLNELVIGSINNKITQYNFNEYICNCYELSNLNINNHFFLQIKLLYFTIQCTILRNGDLKTKIYFTIELPIILNPNIKSILENLKLPLGIKKIIIYENLINIFDSKNIIQLSELQELYIVMEKFNIELINLPSKLKILSISSNNFNQPLNLLPNDLEYLYINSESFNNKLDSLPRFLKILSICALEFTYDINNLPLGLEILHLNISNNISCSFDYLPDSVLCLYLISSYINSDLSNLPIGLKVLYIESIDLENTAKYINLSPNIKQKLIKSI